MFELTRDELILCYYSLVRESNCFGSTESYEEHKALVKKLKTMIESAPMTFAQAMQAIEDGKMVVKDGEVFYCKQDVGLGLPNFRIMFGRTKTAWQLASFTSDDVCADWRIVE